MPVTIRSLFYCVALAATGLTTPVLAQSDTPVDHPLFTGPVQPYTTAAYTQRTIDLDLTLDPKTRSVSGTAALLIEPLALPLDTLILYGHNLQIEETAVVLPDSSSHVIPSMMGVGDEIVLPLDTLIAGDPFWVKVTYRASPIEGLYASSNQEAFWTSSQPTFNRHWFPSFDAPHERVHATLALTVPQAYAVRALGSPVDVDAPSRGMTTFRFSSAAPLPITALGFFCAKAEGTSTPAVDLAMAADDFFTGTTPEREQAVIRSRLLGHLQDLRKRLPPLPWSIWSTLVLGQDWPPAATSAGTTVWGSALLRDAKALRDDPGTLTIVEALAQQWIGALIGPDHWSELWLPQALAHDQGLLSASAADPAHRHRLLLDAQGRYLAESQNYQRPLVWDRWEHPLDLFDSHARDKGLWLMHMLRLQLGDEAVNRVLRRFMAAFTGTAAQTEDLSRLFQQNHPDANLGAFFDAWAYSAGHPILESAYTFEASQDTLILTLRQVQEGFLIPAVFPLHLTIDVHTLIGPRRFEVVMDQREQTLALPLRMPPRFVEIDPAMTYLIEHHHRQPVEAWVAQMRNGTSLQSRQLALWSLRPHTDDPALLIALRNAFTLEQDPALRAEMALLMGRLPHSQAVASALQTALQDPAAAVREAAIDAHLHATVHHAEVVPWMRQIVHTDSSYQVQAAALRALVAFEVPDAEQLLRSALVTPSYGEIIRATALRLLPEVSPPLGDQTTLALEHTTLPSHGALKHAALPLLLDAAPRSQSVRRRLVALMADPDPGVREATVAGVLALDHPDLQDALSERIHIESHPAVLRRLQQPHRTD